MNEDTLCQLAIRLPQLETLSLEDYSNAVTDVSLKQVFEHQSKLQTLILENCCRLSDDSILASNANSKDEHLSAGIQRLQGLRHQISEAAETSAIIVWPKACDSANCIHLNWDIVIKSPLLVLNIWLTIVRLTKIWN